MKQRSHAYCQNIKNALRGLHSREGAVVLAVGLLLVVLAAATWLHQPQSYSPVENRGMAWFLDWSNVTKAHFSEDFETHVQDQFPLRNQFRQGKALVELYALGQRDVDGVYETGGWMAELEYPQRTGMLDHVAQKIQWVYDHYLAGTDATCYLSVVPDKHYYLSQTNGYPALDYDGLIQSLRAQIPAMPYIDLTDLLSLDDYYRTDSHWRQEKILPVAQRLAETMGTTIDGPEVYAPQRFNRAFVGRYAVQLGLTMEHDTLTYLTSPTLHQCYTVVYDQMGRPQRGKVYEVAYGYKNYPYVMFLSGSKGLIQLTNLKAPSDKNLILFRDSFGSSLAPLLASGYRTITLVDLRYITSAELGKSGRAVSIQHPAAEQQHGDAVNSALSPALKSGKINSDNTKPNHKRRSNYGYCDHSQPCRSHPAQARSYLGADQDPLRRGHGVRLRDRVHPPVLRQAGGGLRPGKFEDLHRHRLPQRLQHHCRQDL